MIDSAHLIFIHGLDGSSQGQKATLLRGLFSDMLIPDFRGTFQERMAVLGPILGSQPGWTIIGSSYGGLMGAIFTCEHPDQVRKLVLMAPALILPEFAQNPPMPVDVPTLIYHGRRDEIVPLEPVRLLAGQVFRNLTFNAVDDDHGLYKTAHSIDWTLVLS
jgi:pimeloyl-ACP methyl ester carboxylesterase